jgi:hypothetical protein
MGTVPATCPYPPGSGKPARPTPPAASSSLAVSPDGTEVFVTGAGSFDYATVVYQR